MDSSRWPWEVNGGAVEPEMELVLDRLWTVAEERMKLQPGVMQLCASTSEMREALGLLGIVEETRVGWGPVTWGPRQDRDMHCFVKKGGSAWTLQLERGWDRSIGAACRVAVLGCVVSGAARE